MKRTAQYINEYGTPFYRVDTFEFIQRPNGTWIKQDGDSYDDPDTPNGLWPTDEAQQMYHDLCNGIIPIQIPTPTDILIFNPHGLDYKAHAASGATDSVYGQATDMVVMGDFNGDGIPDSAYITPQGFTVDIFAANGDVVSTSSYAVANIGVSIFAADFNQDGHLDIPYFPRPKPRAAAP